MRQRRKLLTGGTIYRRNQSLKIPIISILGLARLISKRTVVQPFLQCEVILPSPNRPRRRGYSSTTIPTCRMTWLELLQFRQISSHKILSEWIQLAKMIFFINKTGFWNGQVMLIRSEQPGHRVQGLEVRNHDIPESDNGHLLHFQLRSQSPKCVRERNT